MAISNSVARILPGMGSASVNVSLSNVTTNTGNTNVVLPTTGAFTQPVRQGWVRAKTLTVGVNATCKIAAIYGTDGTTTVQLYGGDAIASLANTGIDEAIPFLTDLLLTSVNVVINVATNNSTHDVEIAAGP